MNRSFRTRIMAELPESIHRRLNAYELAATAAGVGVLALAPPSEAKIVYTPTHRVINGGTSYKLDLNHDRVIDFTLVNSACKSCGTGADLSVVAAAGNGASGFSNVYASALRRGALIGTRRYFPGRNMAWVGTTGDGGTVSGGSWVNVKNRYLGLKFKIRAKTHYGWARLSVQVDDSQRSITAVLTGYAYETVARKPIKAGQTEEGDDVTASPGFANPDDSGSAASIAKPIGVARSGSLGKLAIGAAGIALRQREQ